MAKTIARSLGEFFGHIVRGVKAPVTPATQSQVVSSTVREQSQQTEHGPVTLRRTIIEEVVIENPPAPISSSSHGSTDADRAR
jgi:hypothetical protein